MLDILGTLTGKFIRLLLKFRPEGGQALPGLVIEGLFPSYLPSMLGKLPEGVVIITGTNGKTTTTKMVVEILQANGKKVLTNSTGSNLTRGIVSALSQQATWLGRLKLDIAVLEVDEATARLLIRAVRPRWVLGLNVSRDQLDRYGEVDTVAGYVGAAMAEATEGVITNAGDPHLLKIAQKLAAGKKKIIYFGAAASLRRFFPSDYELAAVNQKPAGKLGAKTVNVVLEAFSGQNVTYRIEGQNYKAGLLLSGQHNFLNGAAALALCRQVLPGVPAEELVAQLAKVSLAFGRGEKYRLGDTDIELVLVKNPASFTQALLSYGSAQSSLMIAINDNLADGRDVSWLWDVDFHPLRGRTVAVTSGSRAADMALRLSYDDITVQTVEPRLITALKILAGQPGPRVVLTTYTAMLQLYSFLSKKAEKLP